MRRTHSPFVTRTVSLVEGHRPLLYQRCHTDREVREDATSPEQKRRVALGLPFDFDEDTNRRIQEFLVPRHTPEAMKGASHQNAEGNAEEAQRIRTIMGFVKHQETQPSAFTFDFGVRSSVAESKKERPWSVFVGGMPYSWSRTEVSDFWAECGEVADVECMTFRDTGRFKGIARVSYRTEEGYRAALACNGDSWEGFSFVVSPWKVKESMMSLPMKRKVTSCDDASLAPIGQKTEGFDVLFMCQLPLTWTADDIAKLFREFEIEAVKLKTDSQTGRSKGYAHIHFGRADHRLEEAIKKLDQREFEGQTVRLGYAIPPPNWKPKTTEGKKRALHARDMHLTPENFETIDGRFLVRLSGLLPTATESEIRDLFVDVVIEDILFIWSVRNQRNSGAVYLMIPDRSNLDRVLAMHREFYQGRRLHVRPGKYSDYVQKAVRFRKGISKQQHSAAPMRYDDIDDPLMSLL